MPYPATALPYVDELLIGGTWVDVTTDVRDTAEFPGPQITRGRADESARVTTSTCNLTLSNKTGAYSNRLPTSPYYALLGRNTQLRHRLRWLRATFSGSASNGWATTDTGQPWTTTGGSASDYAENGGLGKHTLTTVSTARNSIAALPVASADVQSVVVPSATATGDILFGGPCLSDGTTNNLYQARLQFRTDGTVWLEIIKRVAGVQTTVKAAVQVGSYGGGTQYTVRIQRHSGYLRAAAYLTSSNPTTTTWTLVSDSPENELTDLSSLIMRSQTGAANTNVNPIIAYDNAEANNWRFWGEVPQWPQVWSSTDNDVTAPIEAAGIMRRLGAGGKPLKSAFYRATMASSPIAFWPMDDAAGSGTFASAVAGVAPMSLGGAPVLGSIAGPGGAPASKPDFTNSGTVAGSFTTTASGWRVEFLINGFGGGVAFANIFNSLVIPGGSSIIKVFAPSSGSDQFIAANDSITCTFAYPFASYSGWYHVAVTCTAGGTYQLWVNGVAGTSQASTASKPYLIKAGKLAGTSSIAGSIGGIAVLPSATLGTGYSAMLGYAGETAGARLVRLCGEEGIALDMVGDPTDTPLMGAQTTETLLTNLQSCADVDQGILGEPRDAFGLMYRTNHSMLNQTGPSLDYAAGRLAPPLTPTEDDQLVRNSVTATRPGGSTSVPVAGTTGTLSTQNPPLGIGLYDTQITVNTFTDAQLPHEAGWQVRLGTWDEARYPVVNMNFVGLLTAGQIALAGRVAALDVGDYFAITNPPAWLPPDAIELLAEGYREAHRGFEWTLALNCVPAGPYNAMVIGDQTDGRLDTDGSILSAGVNSAATSLVVASTAGPEWIITGTRPGDFPFSIGVAGERMTVTAADSSMVDNFGRTVTGGWGSATSGQAYTLMGTAANFNTTGSKGTIAPSATGNDRIAYVTLTDDGTYRRAQVNVSFDALPASGSLRAGLALRMVDVNNFYAVSVSITSTGALSLQVDKRVATVLTTIATIPTGITLVPATEYTLLAEINRSTITAAVCLSGTVQRPSITLATDTDLPTGTLFGCYGRDASASATHTFSYDALRLLSPQTFTVTRSANTVSKSQAAGAAVSLWRPSALAL